MSEQYKNFARLLKSSVINLSQSFYDKFVAKSSRQSQKAGCKTTITRTSIGKCCDWCDQLMGTYEYGKQPDEIFQRHENCTCMVTYNEKKDGSKGYTDVWSKKEFDSQREARIAREEDILVEQEKSNKARKSKIQETLVDNSIISSSEYRKRLLELGENKKTTREIRTAIEDMLKHRSGTEYEDLSFINSINSVKLTCDWYNEKLTCKPSDKMMEMLVGSPPGSIIGIHNHPHGSPPSSQDIEVAIARKYKYGLIAGHNGNIYKYYTDENFSKTAVYPIIDKINRKYYNNEDFDEDIGKLRNYGMFIEVI